MKRYVVVDVSGTNAAETIFETDERPKALAYATGVLSDINNVTRVLVLDRVGKEIVVNSYGC